MSYDKRGVCVGTNYKGTASELAGCVNDAMAWAVLLRRRGFSTLELIEWQASRAAILEAIQVGIANTGYLDTLVITFSGHGTWVPDLGGDEADGRDEALCPHDYARGGLILDDDLAALVAGRKRGSRLVILSDSCHSGTVSRLAATAGETAMSRARFVPPGEFLSGEQLARAVAVQDAPARGRPRAGALLISASADQEVAYDDAGQHPPMGAFTRAALACFEDGMTYGQWHDAIRAALPNESFAQTPQIHGAPNQRDWPAL